MAPIQAFRIPSPNILYRIESVEFISYLELYDIDDQKVFLRPLRDSSNQQWIFVTSGENAFKVLNAATQDCHDQRFLTMNTAVPTASIVSECTSQTSWTMKRERGEADIFSFTTSNVGNRSHENVLSVDPESGKLGFLDSARSNRNVMSREMKWKLVEVVPSVPEDTYRIRTWLGRALHVKSFSDVVSVEPLEKKKHEDWRIVPLGNGRWTIMSLVDGSYLGWERRRDDHVKVVKTRSSREWIIESIGGCIYSITTTGKPLYGTHELALSSGETSEVFLKPIKVTQNQIWFFEAVDASNDGPPPDKPGRYPEITEMAWVIRNAQNGPTGHQRAISFIDATDRTVITWFPLGPWPFQLTYTNTNGEFTFGYDSRLVGREDKFVRFDTAQNQSRWMLQRVKTPGYESYYYICAADNYNLVISGETQKYTLRGIVFDALTVATKQEGALAQMWVFTT